MKILRPIKEVKEMHQYTQEMTLKALWQMKVDFQKDYPEIYRDVVQLEKKIKAYKPR